jgi:hypothetical protein
MNVQMRVHVLRTFVTHLLVHIHQNEKIAAKIASVTELALVMIRSRKSVN